MTKIDVEPCELTKLICKHCGKPIKFPSNNGPNIVFIHHPYTFEKNVELHEDGTITADVHEVEFAFIIAYEHKVCDINNAEKRKTWSKALFVRYGTYDSWLDAKEDQLATAMNDFTWEKDSLKVLQDFYLKCQKN